MPFEFDVGPIPATIRIMLTKDMAFDVPPAARVVDLKLPIKIAEGATTNVRAARVRVVRNLHGVLL
ncbi:hypothetical protein CWO90_21665 [Bradyrhizobium sp. Leo121]|nr:hypothetical protein CWO90_21665 [Bradyrhizobium sp. Leo121]